MVCSSAGSISVDSMSPGGMLRMSLTTCPLTTYMGSCAAAEKIPAKANVNRSMSCFFIRFVYPQNGFRSRNIAFRGPPSSPSGSDRRSRSFGSGRLPPRASDVAPSNGARFCLRCLRPGGREVRREPLPAHVPRGGHIPACRPAGRSVRRSLRAAGICATTE